MYIQQGYSGLWSVEAPFTITEEVYTCTGLNTFESLESAGLNIFNVVYDKNGLSKDKYNEDKGNKVKLATLTSVNAGTIFIPEIFISNVPRYKVVPYNRTMIGLDLGVLPDDLILSHLKDNIEGLVNAAIGITAKSFITKIPSKLIINEEEHSRLEVARQTNIRYDDSAKTELVKLQKRYDELLVVNENLEELVKELA